MYGTSYADHVLDGRDVEAAGRHVGGDEHPPVGDPEPVHGPQARPLLHACRGVSNRVSCVCVCTCACACAYVCLCVCAVGNPLKTLRTIRTEYTRTMLCYGLGELCVPAHSLKIVCTANI